MYAHISRINQDDSAQSSSYQNHPALFLGLAVGLGLALGIMKTRRSYRSSKTELRTIAAAPPKPRLRERSAKVSQLVGAWQDISDALLGVAIGRAVEAISGQVPGFKAQYERQNAMRGGYRTTEVFSSGR